MLTVEQVMKIAGKHQPDYCSDTHVCFDWQAIAEELNALLKREHHAYEQRITGDGSDWGEIMRNAYDDLMATACESCTSEQMEKLSDYIRAELGNGACHITASATDGLCSYKPRKHFELSCGHGFTLDGLEAPVACAVCGKAVNR